MEKLLWRGSYGEALVEKLLLRSAYGEAPVEKLLWRDSYPRLPSKGADPGLRSKGAFPRAPNEVGHGLFTGVRKFE
jgi:hypothetical protein